MNCTCFTVSMVTEMHKRAERTDPITLQSTAISGTEDEKGGVVHL